MKRFTIPILPVAFLFMGPASFCEAEPAIVPRSDAAENKNDMKKHRIHIRIGEKVFAATLADNPTASAFRELFPLNLKMSDLHGNEKFFHLSSRLPSDDANPGTIRAGDLMLWDSKTVVLFYKSFPTAYRYTRLGRIDDPEGLAAAVGAGEVTIRFESDRGGRRNRAAARPGRRKIACAEAVGLSTL